MTKQIKTMISAVLALLMIFGTFAVFPATASAAGGCLELSSTNQSGAGWSWNASSKTLTLSGATFDDCVWLKVDSATIVLTDGTTSVMHGGVYTTLSNGPCWSGICVGTTTPTGEQQNFSSNGALTIKGNGTLNMTPSTTASNFCVFAINCYSLTIGTGSDNPVLDFTLQNSYFHSYGIQAYAGLTLSSGTVSINCGNMTTYGQDWYACGFFVRNGNININKGSLTIRVNNSGAPSSSGLTNETCVGINAIGSGKTININGGIIDITIAGNSTTQTGLRASGTNGIINVNAGTLKLKNTRITSVAVAKKQLNMGQFTTYSSCYKSGQTLILNSVGTTGTTVTVLACKITWKNDSTTIKTDTIKEGTAPSYTGDTPTKAADAQYTYTFSGWSDGENTYAPGAVLPAAAGNVTYTAQYSTTLNKYTVTWVDWNGTTLETDYNVPYGTTPSFGGTNPTRAADVQYTYNFSGWLPVISSVAGDTTYTAQYGTTTNKYTVTWKNWDGSKIKDEQVEYGTTPSYTDADPARAADELYAGYTFNGWSPALSPVVGNAEYIAQFEGIPFDFFAGYNVTAGGNIDENFFMDVRAAGITNADIASGAQTLTLSFAWTTSGPLSTLPASITVNSANYDEYIDSETGYLKIPVEVCAAEMASPIEVTATANGHSETIEYSVRAYADSVLTDSYKTYYIGKGHTEAEYNKLVDLVKKMLDYGAKAQMQFDVDTDNLANAGIDYTMGAGVTASNVLAARNGAASDMNDKSAENFGLKYQYSTIVFLNKTTIRHYYTINDEALFNARKAWAGSAEPKTDKFDDGFGVIYFEITDIPAAEIDEVKSFTFGGHTYSYSVLDYVAAVLNAGTLGIATEEEVNLATATYWYNQAANAYFG